MYTPHFNYSDRIVNNLVKCEWSKTTLHDSDISYNIKQKVIQQVRTKDIFHMANILKSEITIKDAERVLVNTRVDVSDEIRNQIIKNFKMALEFNRSGAADSYSELDKSIILQLNKVMLNQWRETWEVNFRSFNDRIDDRWDDFVKFVDADLPVGQIETELEELVDWYKYSVPTLTPLVRIAIVFYRLIEIAPFTAGNKFTIIAILDYLLNKNGYGTKTYFSTTRLVDSNNESIIKALMVTKSSKDLTHWVDNFVKIILEGLLKVREEMNEFISGEEKSKEQPFLNLGKRQLKILKYLQNVPTIKREDYCHMMEVSTMTAFRDLNDLVKKKLLKIEGRGRGTKYKLATR